MSGPSVIALQASHFSDQISEIVFCTDADIGDAAQKKREHDRRAAIVLGTFGQAVCLVTDTIDSRFNA